MEERFTPKVSPPGGSEGSETPVNTPTLDNFVFVAASSLSRGEQLWTATPLFVVTKADNAVLEERVQLELSKCSDAEKAQFLQLPTRFPQLDESYPLAGRCRTHSLPCGPTATVLAYFRALPKFNHDCRPNAELHWNSRTGECELYAIKRIRRNEEITISYLRHSLAQSGQRRAQLATRFGVVCTCAICTKPALAERSNKRRRDVIESIHRLNVKQSWRSQPNNEVLKTLFLIRCILEIEFGSHLGFIAVDLYRRAFNIAVEYGSPERTREFARRSIEAATACTGPHSAVTTRARTYFAQPELLPTWGRYAGFKDVLMPSRSLPNIPYEVWLWAL